MNYRDLQIENDAFANIANTLATRRMLAEQRAERKQEQQRLDQNAASLASYRASEIGERTRHDQEEEQIRQKMLDQQAASEKAKSAPMFKWVGEDGVTYEAHSPQEFADLIKQYPAKNDNGKHDLHLTGTDPNTGVQFHQTISVPTGADDTAKQKVRQTIQNFIETTGTGPKPVPGANAPDPGHVDAEGNRLAVDAILKNMPQNDSPTNAPYAMEQYNKLALRPGSPVTPDESLPKPLTQADIPALGGAEPNLPTINSQEDYEALPPGTRYRDSSGKVAIKRASSQ